MKGYDWGCVEKGIQMGVGWGAMACTGARKAKRLVGYSTLTRNVYSVDTQIQMDRILAIGHMTGGNSHQENHSED